jgi:hypothetical protein
VRESLGKYETRRRNESKGRSSRSAQVGSRRRFAASGALPARLDRPAIGGINNANAAGPLADGRREINWDGGGAATPFSATPFNGFQNNRGALFTTPGTGFVQAPPSGLDTFFGRADGLYDSTFDPFSAQRVFTPVASNIMDTTFFVPGTNGAVPATVTAFGAVFSDVDSANISSLQFFDFSGASLGTFFVPALLGQNTFSFLGVQFDGELIFRVRITTGDQVLSQTNIGIDQVVLDDFIFSEPQAVPEPSSLVLLVTGVCLLGAGLRKSFDLPRHWI